METICGLDKILFSGIPPIFDKTFLSIVRPNFGLGCVIDIFT